MKTLVIRGTDGFGGAEIYNLKLIKGFKKHCPGLELLFLTTLPKLAREIEKTEAKVWLVDVFKKEVGTRRELLQLVFRLPDYFFNYLKLIIKLKKEEKFRVVWLQGMTEKISLTLFLRFLGLRVIWLEHGPVFGIPRAKEVLFFYRILACLTDRVITVSRMTAKELITKGVDSNKVIGLPTGIDADYFSPVKKRKTCFLTVGYLGSICWEKGIKEFLTVAELVKSGLGETKFVLLGKGPQMAWAKNWVKNKGLTNCFDFPGFKKDVRRYLGNFDLFFFPTRHVEGLSLGLLEAMAMAVPVVARDIGGNRELMIPDKTGYLFKEEQPEKLADLIAGLLKDKKQREKLGKAARRRVIKYFAEEKWIKQLALVFENSERK